MKKILGLFLFIFIMVLIFGFTGIVNAYDFGDELLDSPDFETNTGWIYDGSERVNDSGYAHTGNYYLRGGDSSSLAQSKVTQVVSLFTVGFTTEQLDELDAGNYNLYFGGYQKEIAGHTGVITVDFYEDDGMGGLGDWINLPIELRMADYSAVTRPIASWSKMSGTTDIPTGTRFIRYKFEANGVNGAINDTNLDDAFMEITNDLEEIDPRVVTSVTNGITYLRNNSFPVVPSPGDQVHWEYTSNSLSESVGVTGMAALVLLNSGATPDTDLHLEGALKYIMANRNVTNGSFSSGSSHKVYETSIAIWALVAAYKVTDPSYSEYSSWGPAITAAADYLISAQNDNELDGTPYYGEGGWGYSAPGSLFSHADGSNTQFALLALEATRKAGLLAAGSDYNNAHAMDFVIRCQMDEGGSIDSGDNGFTYCAKPYGWNYAAGASNVSAGTPTAYGIWNLYCLGVHDDGHGEWHRVQDGITWLTDWLTAMADPDYIYQRNPGALCDERFFYNYIMSLAKVFTFYESQPTAGVPADWYIKLVDNICEVDDTDWRNQNNDGSWGPTSCGIGESKIICTLYAILALQTGATEYTEDWMRILLGTDADLEVSMKNMYGEEFCINKNGSDIDNAHYQETDYGAKVISLPQLGGVHYEIKIKGEQPEWTTLKVETGKGEVIGEDIVSSVTTRVEITEEQNEVIFPVVVTGLIGPADLHIDVPKLDPEITATIDIDPDTLNLKSKGNWITCYTELPDGYAVDDIDLDDFRITGIDLDPDDDYVDVVLDDSDSIHIAQNAPVEIGNYDDDDNPDLMIKFDAGDVIDALKDAEAINEVALIIEGYVGLLKPIIGKDIIRVK